MRGTYTPSRTAQWRTRPCECERCQVVSCNRAPVWKVTCLCSGGGYLGHLLASGGRSCCSRRESAHVLHSSLLALTLLHGAAAVVHYYILQRGGSGGARQQATGRQDAPCQRHAPAPWQTEAISTMTFKHNQTCYIYIFNWCVCSEGRVKGPLAVGTVRTAFRFRVEVPTS
jgi:hypothetical protein